jgi:hypothetical protein
MPGRPFDADIFYDEAGDLAGLDQEHAEIHAPSADSRAPSRCCATWIGGHKNTILDGSP